MEVSIQLHALAPLHSMKQPPVPTSMLGGFRAKSGEFSDGKNHDYNIHMEVDKPEFVIQNTIVVSDSLL